MVRDLSISKCWPILLWRLWRRSGNCCSWSFQWNGEFMISIWKKKKKWRAFYRYGSKWDAAKCHTVQQRLFFDVTCFQIVLSPSLVIFPGKLTSQISQPTTFCDNTLKVVFFYHISYKKWTKEKISHKFKIIPDII